MMPQAIWPGTVIPLSDEGAPLAPGGLDRLGPGVLGYAMRHSGPAGPELWVPMIVAEREGTGSVGRFLAALPAWTATPNVTSDRLRGMLQRRGWVVEQHDHEGEAYEVYRKRALPAGERP